MAQLAPLRLRQSHPIGGPGMSGVAMPWSRLQTFGPSYYLSLYLTKTRQALVLLSWLSHLPFAWLSIGKLMLPAGTATGSVGHSELLCLEMRFCSK